MRSRTDRLVLCVLVSLPLAGCAAGAAMRAGRDADRQQDYDRAIVEYTRALDASPDSLDARKALETAKLRSSEGHYARGRRYDVAGRLDEALVELQLALELNPANSEIDDLLRSVRTRLRTRLATDREGKTALQALVEESRDLPPLGATLPAGIEMPDTLVFRDASSRDVFTAIGRIAELTVIFDPQFLAQPVSIDLRGSTLESALQATSAASRSFYQVTADRTITLVPDTPAKRQEYEEEVVRQFFLSNADLTETVDVLRIVIDARRIAPVAGSNAVVIKDTPDRVAAAGRIISAIDKARPEVVIDVELLEVDRTRLREYGLQLASPGEPPTGINGAAGIARDSLTLRDLRSLTQSDIGLTNLPTLFYRLLKSDSNTRTLANPQLRAQDGQSARAEFGERVPVPVTTFSPIATGGVNQQPITSYNYENIGVNIDITPRTHHDNEVSLMLTVNISSISGTGFGGLPTFGNREIETVIRLRDGETNLLAGLIRDDEREVMSGIPGLSDIPVVGRLFAHNRRQTQETDIVLTLTPRIVRVLDLVPEDLRAFRVGRASDAGGQAALPLPLPLPLTRPAEPAGATQPGAVPILPPPPPTAPGPGETPESER